MISDCLPLAHPQNLFMKYSTFETILKIYITENNPPAVFSHGIHYLTAVLHICSYIVTYNCMYYMSYLCLCLSP